MLSCLCWRPVRRKPWNTYVVVEVVVAVVVFAVVVVVVVVVVVPVFANVVI